MTTKSPEYAENENGAELEAIDVSILDLQGLLDTYHRMLVAAQTTGDRVREVLCRNYIGATLRLMGRWKESHQCLSDCLFLARSLADTIPLSVTLTNLGGLCAEMGEFANAVQLLSEALSLARQSENHLRAASALGSLGKVYLSRGDWTMAIDSFSQALELGHIAVAPRHQMCSHTSLALAHAARGDYSSAEDHLLKARTYSRAISAQLQDAPESEDRTTPDGSFTQEERMKRRRDMVVLDLAIAKIERQQQRNEAALAASNHALETARRLSYSYGEISALIEKASTLRELTQLPEAKTCVEDALARAESFEAAHLAASATHLHGEILRDLNDMASARSVLERASELASRVGDSYLAGRVSLDLGLVLLSQGLERRATMHILRGLLAILSLGKVSEAASVLRKQHDAIELAYREIETNSVALLDRLMVLQESMRIAVDEPAFDAAATDLLGLRHDVLDLLALARVVTHWCQLLTRLTPIELDLRESLSNRTSLLEQMSSVLREEEHSIDGSLAFVRHALSQYASRRESRRLQALQTIQIALPGFAATTIYLTLLSRIVTTLTSQDVIAVFLTAATWASAPIAMYRLRLTRSWKAVLLSCVVLVGMGASILHLLRRMGIV